MYKFQTEQDVILIKKTTNVLVFSAIHRYGTFNI